MHFNFLNILYYTIYKIISMKNDNYYTYNDKLFVLIPNKMSIIIVFSLTV